MDIQQIVDAVVSQAQGSPEVLQGFAADPASAIEGIVGDRGLDAAAVSEVAQGVFAQAQEGGLDLAGLLEGTPVSDVAADALAADGLGGILSGVLEGNGLGDVVSNLVGGEGEGLGGFLGGLFGR